MNIVLEGNRYQLAAEQMLMQEVNGMVENFSLSSDFRAVQVLVSPDLWLHIITPLLPEMRPQALRDYLSRPVQTFNVEDWEKLHRWIDMLEEALTEKDRPFTLTRIRSLASIIIMEIVAMRHSEDREHRLDAPLGRHLELVERFHAALAVNYAREHQVQFYAEMLKVSPDHLSKVMRSVTGHPALWWINRTLVAQSRILLCDTSMPIIEVVERLNFGNQSAFGKFFVKHTGVTPGRYRQGHPSLRSL